MNSPADFVIVVAEDLSAEQVMPVLRVCCKFPFKGFVRAERILDIDEENMYLGGYGNFKKIVPFTPEVILEIEHATDDSQLVYLMHQAASSED